MRVDGSKNPEQIPDHVSQEAILRFLSASDEDVPMHRKNAYTRLSGFSDPEGVALLAAAYEFKRRVKEFDEQAMAIKDEHWPTPSEGVRGQLLQLQQQKEALIEDVVRQLQKQLQIYGGSKWDEHILGAKRKMKSFAPELPKRKIGRVMTVLLNFINVSAAPQGGGCNSWVTVYSSTNADLTNRRVYSSASYVEDYNNCGHIYTPSTMLQGGGTTEYGSLGAEINLEPSPGTFLDGYFSSTTDVEGYCPIVFSSYPSGQNSSNIEIVPYFILGMFDPGFSPDNSVHVGGDDSATIKITVNASQGMTPTRSVDCVIGASSVSGTASFNPAFGSMTISGLTGGGSQLVVATYNPTSLIGSSATYNATALLNNPQPSAAQTGILPPPNRTSTATLTVIP